MGVIPSKSMTTRACPGTGCAEILDASQFDASDLVLCEECDGRVEEAVEKHGMHWFTSHLDSTYISWCSHPEIMARSRPPSGDVEAASERITDGAAAAALLLRKAEAVLVVAGAVCCCCCCCCCCRVSYLFSSFSSYFLSRVCRVTAASRISAGPRGSTK